MVLEALGLHNIHNYVLKLSDCSLALIHKINNLYYADDIILIATIQTDLQKIIDTMVTGSETFSFSFNNKKAEVLVMSKKQTCLNKIYVSGVSRAILISREMVNVR